MTIRIQLIDKTGDRLLCGALPAIADAIEQQCNGEFAAAWCTAAVSVEVADEHADDAWPCYFLPTLDDAEALAYHTTVAGNPVLKVGRDVILQNGGSYVDGPNSISAAASHEVLETIADAFCDFYSIPPEALAKSYAKSNGNAAVMVALEVCDPVQGDAYAIAASKVAGAPSVSVSNFVTPEWFRDGASVVGFDHLGVLDVPGELAPGGYVAFDDGSQIFGKSVPAWKREQVRRTGRRIRQCVARHGLVSVDQSEANPASAPVAIPEALKRGTVCAVPGCAALALQFQVLCALHRGGNT